MFFLDGDVLKIDLIRPVLVVKTQTSFHFSQNKFPWPLAVGIVIFFPSILYPLTRLMTYSFDGRTG
jgi:hypothetical protein